MYPFFEEGEKNGHLSYFIKSLTDFCLFSPARPQGTQFCTSKVKDLVLLSTLLPLQLSPAALKSSTLANILRRRQPGDLRQTTSLWCNFLP